MAKSAEEITITTSQKRFACKTRQATDFHQIGRSIIVVVQDITSPGDISRS